MIKKLMAHLVIFTLVLSSSLVGCTKTNNPKPNEPDNNGGKTVDSKTALQNVNFRKALALALEKSFVTDEILANGSHPVDYFVPTKITAGQDFRDEDNKGYNSYDLDKAREHWDRAKEELGFDKITVEILTYDSDSGKKISEYIKAQYEKNLPGIEVTINQQPFKNKLDLANKGEYDINFAGWGPDYPDPLTFLDLFVTGGGHNNTGMSNADFDTIIEEAKAGDLLNDPEKRWVKLQDAEEILINEEVAIIPLYQRGSAYLQQSYLKDIVEPNFGPSLIFYHADTKDANGKKIVKLRDASDIPTMDISLATNSVSFNVIGNVIEGLFKYDKDGKIIPGLVENEKVEGNTYTFKLRKDSKWSNGEAVTAHDFVYSMQRLGNPKTGAQYAFLLGSAGIKNADAVMNGDMEPDQLGVKAVDDYTLQIELDKKVPYFKDLMAFPSFYPQNQKFAEAQGDKYGTSIETVLYNGPFKLSKWKLGYEYEMVKNPEYYAKDSIKIDEINFRIIKEIAAAVNLYNSGDIDRTTLSSEFVSQYIDDPNYHTKEELTIFYFDINMGFSGRS